MHAEDLTGFTAARDALRRVGGVLLTGDAANALAAALVLTTTPLIKAEVLADIADDLYAAAEQSFRPGAYREMRAFALALDNASAQIRKGTR